VPLARKTLKHSLEKIPNPKREILNKYKGSKSKCSQQDLFEFGILDLGFV
jgi:hypothetical protein